MEHQTLVQQTPWVIISPYVLKSNSHLISCTQASGLHYFTRYYFLLQTTNPYFEDFSSFSLFYNCIWLFEAKITYFVWLD